MFKFPNWHKVDELVSILMITWTSFKQITITSSHDSILKQPPYDQAEFISAINAVIWELIPNDAVDTKKICLSPWNVEQVSKTGCCNLRECSRFRIACQRRCGTADQITFTSVFLFLARTCLQDNKEDRNLLLSYSQESLQPGFTPKYWSQLRKSVSSTLQPVNSVIRYN